LIPLHLITGHLGAGKTTLIKNFLSQKPAQAGDWLVLVNEFSALGVDGKILAESLQAKDQLVEVAGGCICCTAKLQVQQSVLTALRQRRFRRIFVEPTGLGLPQSLLELFLRDELAKIVQVATIFCVLDAQSTEIFSLELQERLTLADVIVVNKQSRADAATLEKIADYLNALYPPKVIVYTDFSQVPLAYLDRPATAIDPARSLLKKEIDQELSKKSSVIQAPLHFTAVLPSPLPFVPLPWQDVQRFYQCVDTLASLSWLWPESYQFSLSALRNWQKVLAGYPGLRRAKGIFRLGQSYRLLQWAGDWQEDFIVYRRESLLEIIADHQAPWAQWEKGLRGCLL
jgi:G3E family GTPase